MDGALPALRRVEQLVARRRRPPPAAHPPPRRPARSTGAVAVSLRHVDGCEAAPMPTGVVEVDRVLGGGFVAGSVTLVFGPPGVGKSTLLFQVLASVAGAGVEVLLASAEESLTQVSGRAARIGAVPEHLLALAGNDVVAIEEAIVHHRPALVVVDSIQTVSDDELPGAAGSLAQVRACVDRLTRLAKSTGVPIVLVGHVTKDGDLAGPRTVEHLVDTVLSFDGDRHHALRDAHGGQAPLRSDRRGRHLRNARRRPPGGARSRARCCWATACPASRAAWSSPCSRDGAPYWSRCRRCSAQASEGARPPHGPRARRLPGVPAAGRARAPGRRRRRAAEVFVAAVGGITVAEPAVDLAVALAVASAADGWSCRRTSSSSASSGWPARCGRCPGPTAGWPRLAGRLHPGPRAGVDPGRGPSRRAWSSHRVAYAARPTGHWTRYDAPVVDRGSQPLNDALALIAPGHRRCAKGSTGSCRPSTAR